MTDITAPLNELRAAYRAYQSAKRDKKEEITEKYRARMEDEIRAAVEAEKHAFAKLLADRKEFYGLRVTDIQDHVLRTRNWKVWEDIRDYADIEPEQISRENAREAKARENATYVWSDDYKTLTVLRGTDGKLLDTAIVYEMPERLKKVGGDVYWPVPVDEAVERVAYEGNQAYIKNLSAEISAQIEAGNVPGPNNN